MSMLIHSASAGSVASQWNFEPWAILPLAGTVAVYGSGLTTLWKQASVGAGISVARASAFAGGVLALVIAVASPLDALADHSLAAHMVQHLLLILIAPPLLVLGLPQVALAWAIRRRSPNGSARRWAHASPVRFAERAWAELTSPWVAWIPHAAAVWFWHQPALYQLALRNEGVHALEHISFALTATLVWWTVASRAAVLRRRLAGGILVLLFTAMQTGALGALITLAPRVWYPLQNAGGNPWGLTALEDQQLAGLMMWIPGGVIYLGAAALLFLAWMNRATRWKR